MNILLRWGKFTLVGAIGTSVQLAVLAILNHIWPTNYLYASAAATEITLLHNFIWHWHYTWRDRRERMTLPRQLVRFHLSNGAMSIGGNLIMMRLLVQQAHLPVLTANIAAILACSVANFCLGNNWVFAATKRRSSEPQSPVCSSGLRAM